MATNKHAMIRYQALDKCFSNWYKEYYIDDLIKACNKAIYEFDGTENGVKRRTVFNDISFMESSQGWEAEIIRHYVGKKCYYRYADKSFSINKKDFSDAELGQIEEAMAMLNRFKGMEGFDWIDEFMTNFEDKLGRRRNTEPVIGYEHNPYLEGLSNLSPLFNYIVNKQVLKIQYEHFKKGMMTFVLHPYFIKQYNNRWYLLGVTEEHRDTVTNLALDRIREIEPVPVPFFPNTAFDFSEYFDDVIGISVPQNGKIEPVKLKFDKERYPYIKSKPLHPTQKILDKENCIIEIDVIPTKELVTDILSYGEQVEVLEPDDLRKTIRERLSKALMHY